MMNSRLAKIAATRSVSIDLQQKAVTVVRAAKKNRLCRQFRGSLRALDRAAKLKPVDLAAQTQRQGLAQDNSWSFETSMSAGPTRSASSISHLMTKFLLSSLLVSFLVSSAIALNSGQRRMKSERSFGGMGFSLLIAKGTILFLRLDVTSPRA
jgi:hypothetical protein